ncbi:MAG: hypothetical protein KC731_32260 [Myxococcales bacterium]|nr:hypothetical protein [Myxococcales bacterium]
MTYSNTKLRSIPLLLAGACFFLLLPAADNSGCDNGEVIIGDDDGGGGQSQPGECFVGGCSGQLCTETQGQASTCEWTPSYACYDQVGICERDQNGQCGWRQTQELQDCIANADREPVVGEACVKNAGDACQTDADCVSGGCGGELCFNPAVSDGISTCECTAPSYACGCVAGVCSWYQ